MQLKEFLTKYCSDHTVLRKSSLIAFSMAQDTDFPIVFSSQFITYLKAEGHHVEALDLTQANASAIISQLETSFLGMGLLYKLRGLQEIDKKYRQTILDYLAHYAGPHQVIVCITQADESSLLGQKIIVTLPEVVSSELFDALLCLYKKKPTPAISKFFLAVCKNYEKIRIDQACMIISYMQVMGRYDDCVVLFDRILESEKSLFKLSEYFFAKDARSFFELWPRFSDEYPVTFWCMFWSEQLWKAYHVRYYLDRQQTQQAKSISYRLPFTFLQKDWKKSGLQECKNAHNFMYQLDLAYKNNRDTQLGIELFYTKFFNGQFN